MNNASTVNDLEISYETKLLAKNMSNSLENALNIAYDINYSLKDANGFPIPPNIPRMFQITCSSDTIVHTPFLAIVSGLSRIYYADSSKRKDIEDFLEKYSLYFELSLEEILAMKPGVTYNGIEIEKEYNSSKDFVQKIIDKLGDLVK